MSLLDWRILAGRLFQSRGPAAAKLLSTSREPCFGQWNAARVDVGRSVTVALSCIIIYRLLCQFFNPCLQCRDPRFGGIEEGGHLECLGVVP